MKKRIYLNALVLILMCVLLMSASAGLLFYNLIKNQEMEAVRSLAEMTANLLEQGVSGEYVFTDFISDERDAARITVISPNGTVILDNFTYADMLESHADREEFIQALETGTGISTRFSSTLGRVTYYYAIRLSDGNVLRISKTLRGINRIFTSVLPVFAAIAAGILIIANILARRLTNSIVRPFNEAGPEGDGIVVYDELTPYIKKIDSQKRELNEKISELSSSANTIKAITGNMQEGLITADKNGAVISANQSAYQIFGISDMVNKNILEFCRDIELINAVKRCLNGEHVEIVFERDLRIYSVFMNPILNSPESGGADGGAVILFLEITEKYLAEKQRREFSANVSHELKTPLTAISALSEMILNGMAKEADIKNFAEKITNQSKRLMNIIDDIIRLSEFDEGVKNAKFTSFDLTSLAEAVLAGLNSAANERNVSLALTGERLTITANEQMIDELILNLVDNAIKYNIDGGSVTVDLAARDGFAVISVTDTGIGIPKEHREHVFERFYRVDKSRSKKTGGTGLGLSIVKHIAAYHKGKVELESECGKGTTVRCYIKM